jgi:hypothetical protein
MPARATIFRLREWCSGLGRHNLAQAAVYLLFKYTCTYNSTYILYISHNKEVLWYTRGYIPDISPRGCGGLAESCTDLNNEYTKVPTYAHKN